MSSFTLQSLPTPVATPPPFEMGQHNLEEPYVIKTARKQAAPFSRAQTYSRMLVLIQKFLKQLDGRDKTIKIIQYAFKILLYYKLVNPKQWAAMVSQFSMTRKILRLGLFIGPARKLLFEPNSSAWQGAVVLNEFSNMVGDDLFCLYKLGIVSPSVGKRAEVIAIYCWFLGILNDLADNYKALQDLQTNEKPDGEKAFNMQISIVKLTMDCIFCACDIWQPSFAAGVQAWTGFFSGSLSGYKLWRKIASTAS